MKMEWRDFGWLDGEADVEISLGGHRQVAEIEQDDPLECAPHPKQLFAGFVRLFPEGPMAKRDESEMLVDPRNAPLFYIISRIT
jgi:hypothetical protein